MSEGQTARAFETSAARCSMADAHTSVAPSDDDDGISLPNATLQRAAKPARARQAIGLVVAALTILPACASTSSTAPLTTPITGAATTTPATARTIPTSAPDRSASSPATTAASGDSTAPPNVVDSAFADSDATQLIDQLAASGVAVVDDTTSSPIENVTEPASPVRITRMQARSLALETLDRAGTAAADLDALDPVGGGTHPLSALVAAYAASNATAGAKLSARLLGGQDLHQPGDLIIPTVVLVLFESDVAVHLDAPPVTGTSSSPTIPPQVAAGGTSNVRAAESPSHAEHIRTQARHAASPCDGFSGIINDVLTSVQQALTITPPTVDTGNVFVDQIVQAGPPD